MIRGTTPQARRSGGLRLRRRAEHDRLDGRLREDPRELLRREPRRRGDDAVEPLDVPQTGEGRGSATALSRSSRRRARGPGAPPARPPRGAASRVRPAPCARSPRGIAAAPTSRYAGTSTASSARAIRIAASSTVLVERAGEGHEHAAPSDVRWAEAAGGGARRGQPRRPRPQPQGRPRWRRITAAPRGRRDSR